MNDFVPEGLRHGKGSAIDCGSSWSGDDGLNVAGVATDAFEEFVSFFGIQSCRQSRVPRRHQGAAHELSKMVDVRQAQVIGCIFGVSRRLADCGGVRWLQAVANANFHFVSLACKGEQTAILVLPAKPPHSCFPWRFQNRNLDGLTVNLAATHSRLILRDGHQGVVINRFNEAISQGIQHSPPRTDVFGVRYMLLRLGTDGAIVHQRTAGNGVFAVIDEDARVHEIPIRVIMAHTEFSNLAGATAYRILMARDTGRGVVDRTQSGFVVFLLFKARLIEGKGITGRFRYAIALALSRVESGGIEARRGRGWRWKWTLLGNSGQSNDRAADKG